MAIKNKKYVPRQRKHKVIARNIKPDAANDEDDTNKLEVLPASRREREEKKARMRAELRAANALPKVSGKKAKRLEKYIEQKLRNDENRELKEKLAKAQVDTGLFESTKTLGQGKKAKRRPVTAEEQSESEELDDSQAEGHFRIRPSARPKGSGKAAESFDDGPSDEDVVRSVAPDAATPLPTQPSKPASLAPTLPPASMGSGLKRPLEVDDDGRPVMQKRQKRGGVKSKRAPALFEAPAVEVEDEWNGLSESEAAEDDSDDSEEEVTSDELDGEDSAEDNSDSDDSGSSDEDSDQDSDEEEDDEDDSKPRVSAFKAWAHAQRDEAQGYKPAGATPTLADLPKNVTITPRPIEQDPLPQELQPTANGERKAFSVTVERTPEIQAARLALPILAEEQKVMEAIHNHDVVVISGATGSGKTTQVPQFLFEAGYGSLDSPTTSGMIGITQPRRVAAVSMAKRLAQELGSHGKKVAYQIRFEGTTSRDTAIKFMTDGVLLRELAGENEEDVCLPKYSAIIIDEAHERSVNTDVLIGILSRVNVMRAELAAKTGKVMKSLKLIIMSATLRIEDVTENKRLFPTPPRVIEVEGRQHPVAVHFARKTRHDYFEEMYQKVLRGHRKLPPGGFLVFMTGENEIHQLGQRLKSAVNGTASVKAPKVQISSSEAPFESEDIDFGVDDYEQSGAEDDSDHDEAANEDDEFVVEDEEAGTGPLKMNILPLYSLLPTKEQQRVFDPPPDGHRQIIISTNVAETSLTIPGIRYVFDCGRAKERRYDEVTGVQSFEVGWISKASADQRKGRAGRTGPGHCYRLYSSAVFDRDFTDFAIPELLRTPIETVVLQLKAMGVGNVASFPFPTPPDTQALLKSERLLTYLGALSASPTNSSTATTRSEVTKPGVTMSIFPLAPRFSRMLLLSNDLIHYTIAMVSALSVREVFIPRTRVLDAARAGAHSPADEEHAVAEATRKYNESHKNFCALGDSDALKLLQVVAEYAHGKGNDEGVTWCRERYVRHRAMVEAAQLRKQLVAVLRNNLPKKYGGLVYEDLLAPPTEQHVTLLKQIAAAGYMDQVAQRADMCPTPPEQGRPPRRAIDVPYVPLFPVRGGADDDGLVYIHPSSPMSHLSVKECPQYIVYSSLKRAADQAPLQEDGSSSKAPPKVRMMPLTEITGVQLAALSKGTPLIAYGKPIKETLGDGGLGATTKVAWVVPYLRAEGGGGMGWPLPVTKVNQKREPGRGWVVVD